MQGFLVPASCGDFCNEPSHTVRDEPFSFVAFAIYRLPLINEVALTSCHILQFDPALTSQARPLKIPLI